MSTVAVRGQKRDAVLVADPALPRFGVETPHNVLGGTSAALASNVDLVTEMPCRQRADGQMAELCVEF